MAGIRLEFAQFGDFDSFEIIRSTSSMASTADADLPSPVVTGLKTMYWVDTDITEGTVYYYKVRALQDSAAYVSDELKVVAKVDLEPELNVSISPYGFWKLNDGSGNLLDSSGNARNIIPSITAIRGVDSIDPTGQKCSAVNNEDTNTTTRMIGEYLTDQSCGYNFTVSMWINIPSSAYQTGGEFFKLDLRNGHGFSIGLSIDTSDNVPPYAYGDQNSHSRYLHIGQNGISFRGTNLLFSSDEQDANIIVRWREGYLETFLNGVIKSSRYVGNYNAANRSIGIGRGEGDFRPTFSLKMSRIAVYDGALTDSDILKIASITKVQT